MIGRLLTKIIGTRGERELRRMQPIVTRAGELESRMKALSDAELRAQTAAFRERLERGETLDDILPEAFAAVREAARRSLGMRHFDVQILGGVVLHEGKIAEMKTGEGKTLVATLPAYLNALSGKGVHVITVNDYLAKRDAEWMGKVYSTVGLRVGVIQHDLGDLERKAAYAADVTYGTNNEFGFDYLRDNMKFSLEAMVQRGHHYAIVDEVDSILIDEARTPLIISGPSEGSTEMYFKVDKIIPKLTLAAKISDFTRPEEREALEEQGDYMVDEKARVASLTERGMAHVEKLLGTPGLYEEDSFENIMGRHAVEQGLRAHTLYECDVHYMVKDGQVVIVDEFTGRLMPGRRWSDGLHQAVEAKEGVKIEKENQTLATITFQNFFRMYAKLAGMTGTADTEAVEFDKIYNLEVVVVPTNRSLIRHEFPDVVYMTEKEKFSAVVDEIEEGHKRGQPALVGTVSIEKSEHLSGLLKRRGIKHVVLNARYHAQEAEIVAQAGRLGAVTIATNMAGRGTDILLGGNPEFLAKQLLSASGVSPDQVTDEQREKALAQARRDCDEQHEKVVSLGGLHIIGTERHEARRIDNQLRGRAGRQGDPGSSRFYLSLEDDLMRIFGGDRLKAFMSRLNIEEGTPIESPMVTRSIRKAQKNVEQRNFEIRKHLLEYDDVMNSQRKEIYRLRREALGEADLRQYVMDKARDILDWLIETHLPAAEDPGDWQIEEFRRLVLHHFGIDIEREGIKPADLGTEKARERISGLVRAKYEAKEKKVNPEMMRAYERHIILSIIDSRWKDHLLAMDHLKEGIGLRAYGQRDPLVEYKRESFEMFSEMKNRIEDELVRFLMLFEPMTEEERAEEERKRRREQEMIFQAASRSRAGTEANRPVVHAGPKTGRNEPCPCGSGRKFKKCHGAAGAAAAG
ncbi:MAG: preprotein translocase subunit SecA [Acidobacteria bacterium]|nr:MAG: preprotein translocase subunit SecA [Acidobacteriota bacterium]